MPMDSDSTSESVSNFGFKIVSLTARVAFDELLR